ncbi:MAG TPA: class I SAM-dependent methyltransferase [Patescibacteria group bacterium]|nr:class I SAM-dependent methyltransferase [Patescibacteria group bacterium]
MPNYKDVVYFTDEFGWDNYPQKLCNYLHELYFKKYTRKAKKPKLLDLGSGKGNHLVGFKRLGISTYGLDKRREFLKVPGNIPVRYCNFESDRFPFKTAYFDFIFSKSVIEHVSDIEKMMKESYRVLKPGGIIVIMTPDWSSHFKYFYDDYTHKTPLTRKGLQNVLRLFGFDVITAEYFYQLPFVWKHPWLKVIPQAISLLPDWLKWRDEAEHNPRKIIRFSKEKMLIAVGVKQKHKND